jgi:AraC-like DNA-binding protein
MLLRRTPVPPLDRYVETVWASERGALPHPRERNLPSGRADLVIALRQEHLSRHAGIDDRAGVRLLGAVFQGPQERCFLRATDAPSSVVGVHFRAGGAAAFAGVAPAELANRSVALHELWGSAAHQLREQLQALPSALQRLDRLEQALLARLQRSQVAAAAPAAVDAALAWAITRFDARPSVARVEPVRAALGWSAPQFITRFHAAVGLTPKRYCRVRRFQAVLGCIAQGRDIDWAGLALDGGYSDQAHFNREFRAFSGLTPSRYRPVAPDQASHVAEWG